MMVESREWSCQLGEGAAAWQKLERLQADGSLTETEDTPGDQAAFLPYRRSFLLKNGYCKGTVPGLANRRRHKMSNHPQVPWAHRLQTPALSHQPPTRAS